MSKPELNCTEASLLVYEELYGVNLSEAFGISVDDLWDRLKDNKLSMTRTMDQILLPRGFIRCKPETGDLSCVKGATSICISEGLFAVTGTSGTCILETRKGKGWRCPKLQQ